MTQKIAYILVGITGSGKSSYVRKLWKDHAADKVGVLSMDDVRLMVAQDAGLITGESIADSARAFAYCVDNPDVFSKRLNEVWRTVLQNDVVIVDNMNHTRKGRARWVAELRQKGFEIHAVHFMRPLGLLIERQKTRDDKEVPENRVRQIFMQLQELQSDEYDTLTFI